MLKRSGKTCRYFLLLLAFFLIPAGAIYAQNNKSTLLIKTKPTFKPIVKKFNNPVDSGYFHDAAKEEITNLYNKGYLKATLDSIYFYPDTTVIKIIPGQQYRLKTIEIQNSNSEITRKLKSYINGYYSYDAHRKVSELIIQPYLNNGFPLAMVKLNPEFNGNNIFLHPKITKGPQYSFDSIHWTGSPPVTAKTATAITGIRPGLLYSQKLINLLPEKINNSGFLQLDSTMVSIDSSGLAKVRLKVNRIKSNTFSGIIGIAQDQNSKTQVTGHIELNLTNALSFGEQIDVNWKKTDAYSQLLSVKTQAPYLFGWPAGIFAGLNIDKQDTSFNHLSYTLGGQFKLDGQINFRGYYKSTSTNDISTNQQKFNAYTNRYGLSFGFRQTDSWLQPKKGFIINFDINYGNRTIETETSAKKTPITEMFSQTQWIVPLIKTGFLLKTEFRWIKSDSLQRTELYRLGGKETLRGFPERSIFSDKSLITMLEYHYYFNTNSSVFVFSDAGFLGIQTLSNYKNTQRYASGLGLNLMTRAGLLNITYAVGIIPGMAVSPTNGQVHIGYKTYF